MEIQTWNENATHPSGNIVLDVKGLKAYLFTRWGIVKAVDDISFKIREKETLGIVGESGCGKSMMALALLQLMPKPAGRIIDGKVFLDGEDLLQKSDTEMRKIRGNKMFMILQDPQTSLDPVFMIGNQLIESTLKSKTTGKKSRTRKVIEALRMMKVSEPERRLSSFPHEMSGGMKQRVVSSMGILCQPKVLIADEPTTALDVTIQAQFLRLLKNVQKETGVSIIFITHDFGVVARMCDRVAVMYAGRVIEEGPVRDIFNNPLHPYTKSLLASVPRVDKDIEELYSIEGQPPALYDLPSGCHFSPRCAYSKERCRREYPSYTKSHLSHKAACWELKQQ